jgi:hypothetical protein
MQRARALASLLATVPEVVGDALLPDLYSPHLDMGQRLLLLDCLAAAAQQLANPEAAAPQLELGSEGGGGAPRVVYPGERRGQVSFF